jgi:hypothetical protein
MPPFELAAPWVAVSLLGGSVGLAELLARYRDSPWRAIRTWAAALYVALNAAISVFAYALANAWNLPAGSADPWTRVLLAGLGGTALFRTSLFIARVGDRDVGLGPSTILQVFLGATDAEVDRLQGMGRSIAVAELMAGLDYAKAAAALPPYCLALMQNVPNELQAELRSAVANLNQLASSDQIKLQLLGLAIVNVVGPDVLRSAIRALGPLIKT